MLKLVISTPDNVERAQNVRMQMESQGITDYLLMPAFMIPKSARTGISRSHKACVRHAKALGVDKVLIMEDDINWLCPGAYNRFIDILNTEVPKEADLFFSGAYTIEPDAQPITERMALCPGKVAGLHAYVVFEKFYDKFLAADEAYNIDHFLTSGDGVHARSYIAYPFVALQHDGWSYNVGMQTNYNQHIGKRFKLWNCG